MKKLSALVGLSLLVLAALASQSAYSDAIGDFSFSLPSGWTLRDYPGLKYKLPVGGIKDGFAQNINIGNEPFDGSLAEYVEATKAAMTKYFASFLLLKEEAFAADSGLQGWKLVVEDVQQDLALGQYFYIFAQDGNFFVVTCTVLAKDRTVVEDLFDASMRTFRFLK